MSREGDAGAQPPREPQQDAKPAGPEEALARPGGKADRAAADGDLTTERESTEQLEELGTGYNVSYVFNGHVDASGAGFGPSGGPAADETRRRTRTGRLTPEESTALCAHFAEPPRFWAAAQALDRDKVVLLTGTAGLGKRTSAIRLLLDAGAKMLEVVSPTLTVEDLSKHDFEAGHGYLVEDWQQASRADGISDYSWRVLRDHVKDSKVHLVITTAEGKSGRSVTHFVWEAPTPGQVLIAYLANGDGDGGDDEGRENWDGTSAKDLIAEVAEHIPDTYPGAFGVGSVAAIGRRLAEEGNSPQTLRKVLAELSSDPGRYVREWLSAERTDDEIQRVTALCFSAGRSERLFDVMRIRLRATLRDSGLLEDPELARDEKHSGNLAAEAESQRPARLRELQRKHMGLLERDGGKVRFQGKEPQQQYLYHRHAVQELWRDYDQSYWLAVREWLAELIGDTTLHDVQVSVAVGLTMLAFAALDEVEDSYLHPWAEGECAWSGQRTAVYVLWLMSRDDSLSPVALRIATDWVNSGDAGCQWTAAAALSGELGTAYPATAAARLWHLVGQWRDVPTKAVIALANLFATLTRERDGQEAHQVLELLRDRMNRASGRDDDGTEGAPAAPSASWRDDRRNRERAMLCIVAALSVSDPLSKHPSITSFLTARPEHLDLVAELWAVVLRHRPCRKRALVALLYAVRGFEYVSDDPEAAARSLGDALTKALPVTEHGPLSADFTNIVARAKRPKSDTTATVQALLNAFEHLRPTERTAE